MNTYTIHAEVMTDDKWPRNTTIVVDAHDSDKALESAMIVTNNLWDVPTEDIDFLFERVEVSD